MFLTAAMGVGTPSKPISSSSAPTVTGDELICYFTFLSFSTSLRSNEASSGDCEAATGRFLPFFTFLIVMAIGLSRSFGEFISSSSSSDSSILMTCYDPLLEMSILDPSPSIRLALGEYSCFSFSFSISFFLPNFPGAAAGPLYFLRGYDLLLLAAALTLDLTIASALL